MRDYLSRVLEMMKPKFNELIAYLTALTCTLLLFVHQGFSEFYFQTFNTSPTKAGLWFLIMSFAVFAGFILSIIHVFIKREKLMLEKTLMALFVMAANGFAGIAAGIEMLPGRWSILILLPLWNIVTGIVLLYQIGLLNANQIVTDENASALEITITTLLLLALFIVTHFWLRLSWALTFSICMFYTSAFAFAITWLINRFQMATIDEK
jgi:hypothetical protein